MKEAFKKHKKVVVFVAAIIIIIICCIAGYMAKIKYEQKQSKKLPQRSEILHYPGGHDHDGGGGAAGR